MLKENTSEIHQPRIRLRFMASVLIPAVVLIFIYIAAGIAPFGDKTLAYSDAWGQYNTFYNFYRNLLTGNRDWLYSFEKVLGDGIASLFAYYIASPFNLIYLLFSQADTPIATDLIILLKVSLCGLTSAIWFRHSTAAGLSRKALLFTTAYALCGYNTAYCFNTMWLDSVLLLPLMALGIQNLLKGKSPLLYVLSLAFAILFNFYTGYMLCIFSVGWSGCNIIRSELRGKQLGSAVCRYAFASLLAGGLSAVLLLPAVKALGSGTTASQGFLSNYIYSASMRILQLLGWEEDRYRLALLGLIGMVGSEALLVLSAILTMKKKPRLSAWLAVASVFLLTGFYLCVDRVLQQSYFATIENTVLNAKNFLFGEIEGSETLASGPFVYIGLMNLLLALSFFFNRSISRRNKTGLGALLGLLCVSFLFYLPNVVWHGFQVNNCFNYRYSFMIAFVLLVMAEQSLEQPEGIRPVPLGISAVILIGFAVPVTLAGYESGLRLAGMAVLTVFFTLAIGPGIKSRHASALLGCAAFIQIALLGWCAGATLASEAADAMSLSEYQEKNAVGAALSETLQGLDSSFSRVREEKTTLNHNDAMQFGFNGAYHYSSTQKPDAIRFLASIGIRTRQERWAQYGTATRAADMLLGFKYDISSREMMDYVQVSDGILQNPYALPLAFEAGAAALTDEMPEGANAFETLNGIYRALLGWDDDLFYVADAELDQDEQAVLATLNITSDDGLYVRVSSDGIETVTVTLNGEELLTRTSLYKGEALPLGIFEQGDKVTVKFSFAEGTEPELSEDCFYYESTNLLKNASEALPQILRSLEVPTDSHIIATVNTETATALMFTIPYDSGWGVTVDGNPVTPEKALGAFIAVSVPEGAHIVELRYVPEGLIPGTIISSISLLALTGWLIIRRRRAPILNHP